MQFVMLYEQEGMGADAGIITKENILINKIKVYCKKESPESSGLLFLCEFGIGSCSDYVKTTPDRLGDLSLGYKNLFLRNALPE